jgi:hypothetical protein
MTTPPQPLSESKQRAGTTSRIVWIGAASFEERCVGSLQILQRSGRNIGAVVLLTYSKDRPNDPYNERRKLENIRRVHEIGDQIARVTDLTQVEAYTFDSIIATVSEKLRGLDARDVILDISCFTRIHVIALAWLAASVRPDIRWRFAYTSPENYRVSSRAAQGWQDLLLFSLDAPTISHDEAGSRGLLQPGHQSDRLQFSLGEVEPSGGTIMIAKTPNRPDWIRTCRMRNRELFERLTSSGLTDWKADSIDAINTRAIADIVDREVQIASSQEAPIVVFPYGPKWMLFVTSARLSQTYASGSWFVYAVPIRYDVHSEGVGRTTSFDLQLAST